MPQKLCFLLKILGATAFVVSGAEVDTIQWMDPLSVPVWQSDSLAQSSSSMFLHSEEKQTQMLQTQGSKSIRVTVGESGTEVQQELRLGIQGEAAPGWWVEGRLVDEGLSAGEMRVTTLQDVDQMVLRFTHEASMLELGNFTLKQRQLRTIGLEHASLGAHLRWSSDRTTGEWAWGESAARRFRTGFAGNLGQQKGYLISQVSGYVAMVPGSQKIWLNGTLLEEGKDYQVDAVGGVIDFEGSVYPGPQDWIEVEYEVWDDQAQQRVLSGWMEHGLGAWNVRLQVFEQKEALNKLRRLWSKDQLALVTADTSDLDSAGLWRPWKRQAVGANLRGRPVSNLYMEMEISSLIVDTNTLSARTPSSRGRGFFTQVSRDSVWRWRRGWNWMMQAQWEEDDFIHEESWGRLQGYDDWELQQIWGVSPVYEGARGLSDMHLGWRQNDWRVGGQVQGLSWGKDRLLKTQGEIGHVNKAVNSSLQIGRLMSPDSLISAAAWLGTADISYQDGLWRPFAQMAFRYADTSSTWSDAHLDFSNGLGWESEPAQGAVTWGVHRQGDSLHILFGELESFWQIENVAWESQLRWSRQKEQIVDSLQKAYYWNINQNLKWSWKQGDGHLTWQSGLTQNQGYYAAYIRVPDGTGDVIYDSLSGRFIEGVDQGNYRRDGSQRLDSVPQSRNGELVVDFEQWIPLSSWTGIRFGILRDLQIGLEGRWEARDTTGAIWKPSWRTEDFAGLYEGSFVHQIHVNWRMPDERLGAEGTRGMEGQLLWAGDGSYETHDWWESSIFYRLIEPLQLRANFLRENRQRPVHTDWQWDATEFGGFLDWSVGNQDWVIAPGVVWRGAQGAFSWGNVRGRLWQGLLQTHWNWHQDARMNAQYSYNRVTGIDLVTPWDFLKGYQQGTTHRIQGGLDWTLPNDLWASAQLILRRNPGSENWFMKMQFEAKAFF